MSITIDFICSNYSCKFCMSIL